MYFLLSNDLLTHSGFSPCPSGLIKTSLFSGKLSLSNRLHSSFCLFVTFILKDSLYFFLFKKTFFIYVYLCLKSKMLCIKLAALMLVFVFHWRKRKAPHHKVMQLYCCAASVHDDKSSELSQSLCAVPNSAGTDGFC